MKLKRNAGLALVLTLVAVSGAARADIFCPGSKNPPVGRDGR